MAAPVKLNEDEGKLANIATALTQVRPQCRLAIPLHVHSVPPKTPTPPSPFQDFALSWWTYFLFQWEREAIQGEHLAAACPTIPWLCPKPNPPTYVPATHTSATFHQPSFPSLLDNSHYFPLKQDKNTKKLLIPHSTSLLFSVRLFESIHFYCFQFLFSHFLLNPFQSGLYLLPPQRNAPVAPLFHLG